MSLGGHPRDGSLGHRCVRLLCDGANGFDPLEIGLDSASLKSRASAPEIVLAEHPVFRLSPLRAPARGAVNRRQKSPPRGSSCSSQRNCEMRRVLLIDALGAAMFAPANIISTRPSFRIRLSRPRSRRSAPSLSWKSATGGDKSGGATALYFAEGPMDITSRRPIHLRQSTSNLASTYPLPPTFIRGPSIPALSEAIPLLSVEGRQPLIHC